MKTSHIVTSRIDIKSSIVKEYCSIKSFIIFTNYYSAQGMRNSVGDYIIIKVDELKYVADVLIYGSIIDQLKQSFGEYMYEIILELI